MKPTLSLLVAGALATLASSAALATNGYFAHGYGVKAEGIVGIGIALPQDSLAAAANPAGVAWVGDRLDLGINVFTPERSSDIHGNGYGLNGHYDGNDTRQFYIPEFGYTRQLSPSLGFGLAVYGNGGMNTDYKRNPFAAIGAQGSAGVDLSQLFITPSLAWKVNDSNSIGIGINLAYQQFTAKGLQPFAQPGFSADPNAVTSNQHDSSTGAGVRLGWTGQITPDITLGATWSSRTRMGKFDKYKGLFADQGGFDIPENYGVGLTYKATPRLTLATEVQRILYSDVSAVGNPINGLLQGQALGSSGGPGFGWKDINVYRPGASYDLSDTLTLRGGYSHADQPVPSSQTLFNVLAPGVVQNHVSLGATGSRARAAS
ncbi:OmpP1/FadL family transporter [Paludibacterium denitrificans]|uniref:OmpP1/FadL family transporter n=1 Tax=Paludibacterium denitrificans TaxID=2675226 RepID=UPI001E5DC67B|nr:outer membrane protein transport protein [Paludibacterium denitrificans]